MTSVIYAQDYSLKFDVGLSKFNNRIVNYPTYTSEYDLYEDNFVYSSGIGILRKLKLSNSFHLNTGILYDKKGSRLHTWYITGDNNLNFNDTVRMTETKLNSHLHYLSVPLTVQFSKYNFFVGGQVSCMVFRSHTWETTVIYQTQGDEYLTERDRDWNFFNVFTNYKYYKILDFGVLSGIEKQLRENIIVGFQYYQGLQQIMKYNFFIDYTNSQFLITLKYKLQKKEVD